MNAKTDRWESYTDEVGRRHWRWPASNAQRDAGHPLPAPESPNKFGVAGQQLAQRAPHPLKAK